MRSFPSGGDLTWRTFQNFRTRKSGISTQRKFLNSRARKFLHLKIPPTDKGSHFVLAEIWHGEIFKISGPENLAFQHGENFQIPGPENFFISRFHQTANEAISCWWKFDMEKSSKFPGPKIWHFNIEKFYKFPGPKISFISRFHQIANEAISFWCRFDMENSSNVPGP